MKKEEALKSLKTFLEKNKGKTYHINRIAAVTGLNASFIQANMQGLGYHLKIQGSAPSGLAPGVITPGKPKTKVSPKKAAEPKSEQPENKDKPVPAENPKKTQPKSKKEAKTP